MTSGLTRRQRLPEPPDSVVDQAREDFTRNGMHVLAVQQNPNDPVAIIELCQAGKIVPVIDRRYPLREVPEALRYVGEGRAQGKVVITVA
jgi:NADPH:quinone reductase-like Zn-dependent oxidoreductase